MRILKKEMDRCEWSALSSDRFTPIENGPGTYGTRGFMGLRLGPDVAEKRKLHEAVKYLSPLSGHSAPNIISVLSYSLKTRKVTSERKERSEIN